MRRGWSVEVEKGPHDRGAAGCGAGDRRPGVRQTIKRNEGHSCGSYL